MGGAFVFRFGPHVRLSDAEMSLHLAMCAVEGLAGRAQVRLSAAYQVDPENHAIGVDASTGVGQMIARVFAGLLLREFGEDAFRVERVGNTPDAQPQEVHG